MHSWMNLIGNALTSSRFSTAFLDTSIKSFVLLACAAIICLCCRRGSAALRHLIWSVALIGCLLLPWLAITLPAWQKPLWTLAAEHAPGNEITVALDFAPGGHSTGSVSEQPNAGQQSASNAHGSNPLNRAHTLAGHFNQKWLLAVPVI